MSDIWVFGYGSLMWRPGFAFEEARLATAIGRHRALCVYSVHYRGTSERPGLVFGLDLGGQCEGMAFRVAAANAGQVLKYLRDRELVTGAYLAESITVHLHGVRGESGLSVGAVGFRANRVHRQYAGKLCLAEQAMIVRASVGVMGSNRDYVMSTARHLRDLGIRDVGVERLVAVLGRTYATSTQPPDGGALARSFFGHQRPTYPRRLAPKLPPRKALHCAFRHNAPIV
jgi:glutathione-specific gamma-glutamylcyclotransferase